MPLRFPVLSGNASSRGKPAHRRIRRDAPGRGSGFVAGRTKPPVAGATPAVDSEGWRAIRLLGDCRVGLANRSAGAVRRRWAPGDARRPDSVMRPSRRPAPRQRSGLRGSHATEDRWSVHTARPDGHACPGSRVAAAPAWRNGDASAARTARGGASRPPAKALEVRWCVHRASISPRAGKAWRRPGSDCKIRCPGALGN